MAGGFVKDFFQTVKNHFRRYTMGYLLLTVVFLAGLAVGFGMPERMGSGNYNELSGFLSSMLKQLPTAQIDGALEMTRAFYMNGILLALIWFLGFTIIGSPLVAGVLFYKGLCLGMAVAFLLQTDNTQGVIMILLTVLPQNLFLIPLFIIASVLAVSFSLSLVQNSFGGRRGLLKGFLKYTGCFLVLLLMVLFSSYIQGYFDPWLLSLLFKMA